MIRRAGHQDVPFMRSMLVHAYNWRVNVLDAEIPLARYVESWGRDGDVGMVALEGSNRVGAAWFRLFGSGAPGYGFVDEQTPELTAAVVPARRGHGVGKELIDALLEQAAAEGHKAISLSVEKNSPAVAFYERHGFESAGEQEHSLTMRRSLP